MTVIKMKVKVCYKSDESESSMSTAQVKQQRGDRLKSNAEADAFSGAAFSGVSLLFLCILLMGQKMTISINQITIVFHAQDRAVTMGLADGTYLVLEEKMASLLEKEEETLKFTWIRPAKSGGLFKWLTYLVRGEGPNMGRLNIPSTIDLAFS